MTAPTLRELQEAFWRALGCSPRDPGLLALIRPSATLAPAERLAIYSQMYIARLREVLEEDYPRLAAALGADAFDAVVRDYLAAHPPTHPSVRHVGQHFPDFLAAHAAVPPFASDLARLEWTRVEVFDAPDVPPLDPERLKTIPAETWPRLRFVAVPALALLTADWPIHRLWEEPTAVPPPPGFTALRVWRSGWKVHHACMEPREASALRALTAGATWHLQVRSKRLD